MDGFMDGWVCIYFFQIAVSFPIKFKDRQRKAPPLNSNNNDDNKDLKTERQLYTT